MEFYVIVVFLALVLALIGFCLHKVRKVHLMSFALLENVSVIRRETEFLFVQIQSLLALERKLGLVEALPRMRQWAGSPDFLLAVAGEVSERRPSCVMECSSGVSTLVIARCLQLNGGGHVYSLEHDPVYAEKTRLLLGRYGLSDWATVLDAPLQKGSDGALWYAEEVIREDIPPVELLVVDGPPASTASLARFPALPRLISRMSENYLVMLDDADRDEEVETIRRWMDLFPALRKEDLYCEKGAVLLST